MRTCEPILKFWWVIPGILETEINQTSNPGTQNLSTGTDIPVNFSGTAVLLQQVYRIVRSLTANNGKLQIKRNYCNGWLTQPKTHTDVIERFITFIDKRFSRCNRDILIEKERQKPVEKQCTINFIKRKRTRRYHLNITRHISAYFVKKLEVDFSIIFLGSSVGIQIKVNVSVNIFKTKICIDSEIGNSWWIFSTSFLFGGL